MLSISVTHERKWGFAQQDSVCKNFGCTFIKFYTFLVDTLQIDYFNVAPECLDLGAESFDLARDSLDLVQTV